MTFADDDLKRLKRHARKAVVVYERKLSIQYGLRALLFRLIARLEAAEDLIGIPIGSTTWKAREERWRKAAGR